MLAERSPLASCFFFQLAATFWGEARERDRPEVALHVLEVGLVARARRRRDLVAAVEEALAEGGDGLRGGLDVPAFVDLVLQLGVEALGLVLGVDAAADAPAHAEFVTA